MNRQIQSGQRFGRLTVLYRVSVDKWGASRVACKCDCGETCVKLYKLLRRGETRSCGCLERESRRYTHLIHGACKTRAYQAWHNMKVRCQWKRSNCYRNYGGRGIRVCKRWQTFKNFLEDMGHPPTGGTLERKNNNGNYCKSNCRWATRLEQGKNKRNNRLITCNGETHHLSEWSRISGVKITTVLARLNRGLTPEQALER